MWAQRREGGEGGRDELRGRKDGGKSLWSSSNRKEGGGRKGEGNHCGVAATGRKGEEGWREIIVE